MTNLSDTAYLVALCRAIETERSKPLFRDPFARQLAGHKANLYAAVLGDIKTIATAIAIRTHLIDEILLQRIQRDRIDTILNLGAGLDTRPYRLNLPAALTWIEVDLPDIIADKENALANQRPLCCLQRVKLDLADVEARQTLFAAVNGNHQRVLVVSEGILGYLSEFQVADLAKDLHRQIHFQSWVFDFTAKSLLDQVQTQHRQKIFSQYFTHKNEAFCFSPTNGLAFFHAYGWHTNEFRSVWEETRRSNRASLWARVQECLMRTVAKTAWQTFRNQSGIAVLSRSP